MNNDKKVWDGIMDETKYRPKEGNESFDSRVMFERFLMLQGMVEGKSGWANQRAADAASETQGEIIDPREPLGTPRFYYLSSFGR